MGSELSCTPEKRGGGGEQGGGGESDLPSSPPAPEGERSLPLSPSSLPSFFYLREFFSCSLLSERLEQTRKDLSNEVSVC